MHEHTRPPRATRRAKVRSVRGMWYGLAFVVVPAATSAAFCAFLYRSSGTWAVVALCVGAVAFVLPASRWHNLTDGPVPEGLRSPYTIAALSFLALPVIALAVFAVLVLLLGLASHGDNTL